MNHMRWHDAPKKRWGPTLWWIATLGVATWAAFLCVGCAATSQSNSGWQPQSRLEMKNLIGNTVLQAMDQYRTHLRKHAVPRVPRKPGDAT